MMKVATLHIGAGKNFSNWILQGVLKICYHSWRMKWGKQIIDDAL